MLGKHSLCHSLARPFGRSAGPKDLFSSSLPEKFVGRPNRICPEVAELWLRKGPRLENEIRKRHFLPSLLFSSFSLVLYIFARYLMQCATNCGSLSPSVRALTTTPAEAFMDHDAGLKFEFRSSDGRRRRKRKSAFRDNFCDIYYAKGQRGFKKTESELPKLED